ncbi:cysteine--tRNA ligase [Candidatus Saccharibacteria bacterium]|nr:cysteine--tRNA ligase [Candidatus Saccharibacteria bacterium]
MKLYNTLSRKIDEFQTLDPAQVRMYSCGPTVYDHIHIGNLSAFIAADTLRRVLRASGYEVRHIMNFTDVDDKTIRRSAERYPALSPEEALTKLTDEYKQIFLDDMAAIGCDISQMQFISAVDSIEGMRRLITELHSDGFAYIADDGVYFSIQKYINSGKKYGQLLELDLSASSASRIDNDEYDKETAQDFALWKTRKADEPAWDFELDGQNLLGRPGWHIECSVMSASALGQPFDIHTGGIDLIFPHHENEIAQSTAGKGDTYAKYFIHNEHLLVEGKKMSKSLGNFYTLQDIKERGIEPLAFRLMILQSHYRHQSNFTWENLKAAQNRLRHWQSVADLKWQPDVVQNDEQDISSGLIETLQNDLATPQAIALIDNYFDKLESTTSMPSDKTLHTINSVFGINLLTDDITSEQKQLITERLSARSSKDWKKSDELRDQLEKQGIGIKDTPKGTIWHRL